MAKPIFQIKRQSAISSGIAPNNLTKGELAVDLAVNKFYIGTTDPLVPIMCSTKIVDNASFQSTDDPYVATEQSIKTYITNNYNPTGSSYTPKNTFQMRIPSANASLFGVQLELNQLYTSGINFFIDQNTNNFLLVGEDVNIGAVGSGIYQRSANNMYLHVSYSVLIKSVASNLITSETDIFYSRGFGMVIVNADNDTLSTRKYYGFQTSPPALAAPNGLPTHLSGSAIVKLPKYRYGTATGDASSDFQRWELRFFSQIRSSDTMFLGNGSAINDPPMTDNYKIKIEIVKLFED